MSFDADFKFESFEEYFGDADQVRKTISSCKICGSSLVHSHVSDYSHLLVQESARCADCGCDNGKKVHSIN